MRRSIPVLLLLLGWWSALAAADVYTFTPATGDWQDPANWEVDSGSGPGPASAEPSIADDVVIPAGKTVTIGNPMLPIMAGTLDIDGTLDMEGTATDGGFLILGTDMTIDGELRLGGENLGDATPGGTGQGHLYLQSSVCAIGGSGGITVDASGSFNTPIIEVQDSASIGIDGVAITAASLILQQATPAIPADPIAVPAVVSTMSTIALGHQARLSLAEGTSLSIKNGLSLENGGRISLAENARILYDAAEAGTSNFIQDAAGILDWTLTNGSIQGAQVSRAAGTLHLLQPATPPVSGDTYQLFSGTFFVSTEYPAATDFATITGAADFSKAKTTTSYGFTYNSPATVIITTLLSGPHSYGDTIVLAATSDSGGAITWSTTTPGLLSVTGNQAVVIGIGSGASVTATVAAIDAFGPGTSSATLGAISAKALAVTVDGGTRAFGVSPNPTPTFFAIGLADGDDESVLGAPVYSGAGTTAGPATAPGSYAVTAGFPGVDAHYTIGSVTAGHLVITATPPAITIDSALGGPFTYGDAIALAASSDSGGAVSWSTTTPGTIALSGSTATIIGVGNASVTAHVAANGAFAAGSLAATLGTIAPKPITVTVDGGTRAFGQANPTPSFTIATLAAGDTASDLGTPTFSGTGTTADASTAIGSYPVTVAFAPPNPNYTLAVVDGDLVISAAVPTLGITTVLTGPYTYGDTIDLAATSDSSGAITWTTSTPSLVSITGATATVIGVGSASITANLAAVAGSFGPASVTSALGTINKKAVAVTVDGGTRAFGVAPNPTPSLTATGLVNGDAVGDLGAPTYGGAGTTAGTTTAVGAYAVTAAFPTGANYAITVTDGTLIITKQDQLITFAEPAALAVGQTRTLAATSDSGLAVAYASSNPAIVSLSGTTLTAVAAGSATITASQAGDGNYNAAMEVVRSITVNAGGTATPGTPAVEAPPDGGCGAGGGVAVLVGLLSLSWRRRR